MGKKIGKAILWTIGIIIGALVLIANWPIPAGWWWAAAIVVAIMTAGRALDAYNQRLEARHYDILDRLRRIERATGADKYR